MAYLPEEGRWPYYLGFNTYLFDNDRKVAAHYLTLAMRRGYNNRLTAALSVRLRAETGSLESAARFLDKMLQRRQDQGMQKYLETQLRLVETEMIIRRLERRMAGITSIEGLRQKGLRWPHPLPDGGELVMAENGQLRSSHPPGRLTLFRSRRATRLQSEAGRP